MYVQMCEELTLVTNAVLVVGGGIAGMQASLDLANRGFRVYLVEKSPSIGGRMAQLTRLSQQWIACMQVKSVILFNNKISKAKEMDVDGVFIQVGEVPSSKIAEEAGVEVDKGGYIIVDSRQRTNIDGVYAAGDVTASPVKQVETAVGQAIVAATEVFGYIKRPYYYKA